MNLRTLAVATATIALATVTAACGSSSSDTGGGSGGSEATASTAGGDILGKVETMFGTVEVPKPAGELRVVALGWSDAEMALAVGVKPVAVMDWQSFGAPNKGVGPWATPLFGSDSPTVIPTGAINYEQIQTLKPDVILNTRSSNDQAEFTKLSEIAPTVYAPTGTGSFATPWETQLTEVGSALGKTAEADKVVAEVTGKIAAAKSANPAFAGKTVASGAKFGDAYGAYLAGDGRFDLLAELGFVQNPPVAALPSNGFFATVAKEQVSALDANVAVILPIGFTLAETQADPLLASLPVVSSGRAVFVDPSAEIGGAWSAASPLSIPVVLDQIVPQLATAVSKAG